MKDMMMIIRDQLNTNETIAKLVDTRIKPYSVPETIKVPFICIRPLDVPVPSSRGSNKELSLQFTYQIEVETSDRTDAKLLQYHIRQEMKKLGFGQLNEGLDEYFEETKHYVDARRYRGTTRLYDIEY